jgi:hypothetical protein
VTQASTTIASGLSGAAYRGAANARAAALQTMQRGSDEPTGDRKATGSRWQDDAAGTAAVREKHYDGAAWITLLEIDEDSNVAYWKGRLSSDTLGVAYTWTALQTFSIGAATPALFQFTGAGTGGLKVPFRRRKTGAAPAANDILVELPFQGYNSASVDTDFVRALVEIVNASAANEGGRMRIKALTSGADETEMVIGGGIAIGSVAPNGVGTLTTRASGLFFGSNLVGTNAVGNRTVSSAAPSGGQDGDVWFKI